MPKKQKPVVIPQSELMTRHTRNRVLLPVALAVLLVIISVTTALAGLITTPIISGFLSLLPLLYSITELRKMIAESRKIMKELSAIAEKNEDVINLFSHKIREPLNNLVMLGGMLRETGTDDHQTELLNTFVASTDAMVEVVNELTMQTAGNIAFEARGEIKFRLGPAIQDAIDLVNLNRRHQQCTVLYNDRGEGNAEYSGDPITIKQIIIDLLTASIPADTGRTAIKIEASISGERDEMQKVKFTLLSNNPVSFIKQGQKSESLAARLISSAGGNWNQVPAGTGSHFVFHVYLRRSTKTDAPSISSTLLKDENTARISKELSDLNVLLVEDNPINQRITQLMLEPLVRRIEIARNGKEALDMFGTSRYDIILMDVQMPVMNGLVAAEKIRGLEMSTRLHIPIIAITANAMLGDKEQCLAVGMDDYISKPIDPELLIEKISALI